MQCLYEVLGVDRDVDEGGLKKAYRKLALQWHPDKNQHNLQEAEERFKEIQNAYEILVDPHERSWYDSHRESILRSGDRYQAGGGGFEGGQRPADEEDLYQYFTSAAFSGFGDGPRGFYGVYDSLFERLAKAEAEAHERRSDRKAKRPPGPFPRFGFSDAPWPEVAAFYAAWSGFGTAKDFAWADQYHTASAPNRRVRRAMEGENDKARRAAKREYNEAVRELVAFLRKRDKRVAAHQVEEAARRQQRQAEDAARREAERQERLARAAAYQEAAWVLGSEEEGEEGEEGEEELAEEEQLVWYCVACEKHFKSAAAFANHERSKKHVAQVELLRRVLEEEEAELGGLAADEQEEERECVASSSSSSGGGSSGGGGGGGDGGGSSSGGSSGGSSSSSSSSGGGSSDAASASILEEEEEEGGESEVGEDDMLARLVAAQQQQRSSGEGSDSEGSEAGSSDGSQGAGSAAHGGSQQGAAEEPAAAQHGPADGVASLEQDLAAVELDGSGDSDWARKPAGKQRGRRGKKPSGAQPAAQEKRRPAAQREGGREGLRCGLCGADYGTRNQLFKHLKSDHRA